MNYTSLWDLFRLFPFLRTAHLIFSLRQCYMHGSLVHMVEIFLILIFFDVYDIYYFSSYGC